MLKASYRPTFQINELAGREWGIVIMHQK